MSIFINYISTFLPTKVLDNKQLETEYVDWDSEKIFLKTGIKERRIADLNETALDLSVKACLDLISFTKKHNLVIDYLIYITQTPDYLFPGNSTILLKALNLNGIPSLDINLACSGYIYGLNIAYSLLIANQAKNIILVTSDTYSKIINKGDKSVRTLFGDGSSASLLSKSKLPNSLNLEIIDFLLGSNGDKFSSLYIKHGGARHPINSESFIEKKDEKNYIRSDKDLFMDGESILNFTLEVVPRNILDLLHKNSLDLFSIKFYLLHQANKFILEFIKKSLKVGPRLLVDMEFTGNTTSSSIPILLSRQYPLMDLKPNDLIVLCGFGVGLSWGSTLLKKA
jgi:3-oxoacyl-[acyl-carrier-protein] synthase-3